MLQIRKSTERGHADHGWLNTYHTFSFSTYRDPKTHGLSCFTRHERRLGGTGPGFRYAPPSGHGNCDLRLGRGARTQDSMGNGEVLRPGEFQRMSAGTGITHSEFNPSDTEPVHLYQIWLFPDQKGLKPSYEQKRFPESERHNRLRLVASPTADDGSLQIHQDARIYLGQLDQGSQVVQQFASGRHGWLQVLRGSVSVNGHSLQTSDGAAVSDEAELAIQATENAEIMLFDLP